METTIQKWGNSLGVRIPGHLAKDLDLKNGSSVEILAEDNRLIIQPSRKKSLEQVLALITEENLHGEHFDVPAGKELL